MIRLNLNTKSILLLLGLALPLCAHLRAQENVAAGDDQRVQYTLILPEEKTPETVKAEENNPFESATNIMAQDGDTEENKVRDRLLSMPVTGGMLGPNGMHIMLGSMRLEAGAIVPAVLPDQQVMLRVKSISSSAIELIWMEKKPTGLPPKVLTINVDFKPRVRYRLPSSADDKQMGSVRRDDVSTFSSGSNSISREPKVVQEVRPATSVPMDASPARTKSAPEPAVTVPTGPGTTSDAASASVLRMLFGNKTPPTTK